MDKSIEQMRYPIGKYVVPERMDQEQIAEWIADLTRLPSALRMAVKSLSDAQLDTPYRPGGWSLRQVVHHLPDSHMNAYIRFKLSVTEDNPVIKPYHEDRWAETGEAKFSDVEMSLNLLDALHIRWTAFLRTLQRDQLKRTYTHPEYNKTFALDEVLGMYVWHGKHHLAHITETIKRHSW